jgi:hypothetical protein
MESYAARASGSIGYEILADGEVIAWTVDGYWALVIVALLDRIEAEGLVRQGSSEPVVRWAGT